MRLSIVATLYRSAAYVDEWYRRATVAAQAVADDDYEIVLVNDGSPDASLERAVRLGQDDTRLVVVDLSRNFGHHQAMMAGLSHAEGDRVFLIDSDLEEDPDWLGAFGSAMDAHPCDVVYGVQSRRKGGWFERWSGVLYYSVVRATSGLDLPQNMVTARLMTRRYVDALLSHGERDLDIGGLWALTGFAQRAYPVVKASTSASTYTLRRRVALMVSAITSFSTAPLAAILLLGIVLFVGTGTVVTWALLYGAFVEGTRRQVVVVGSIWFVGALTIACVGIVGIYLAKVLTEVKQRPRTIVRHVYRHDAR